ncbi:MAG: hypothetical protein N2654_05405 [Deltaproteobacteria bacterium]|nr:hypothetical protein [Deltaproteobacteria bacterium]
MSLIINQASSQNLCRKIGTDYVKWFSINGCPTGFTHINNSIRQSHLRTGSVNSTKIADGTITVADISPNANIDPSKIDFSSWQAPDNSVVEDSIADESVTTDKLGIDIAGPLPLVVFSGKTSADLSSSSGSEYLYPNGKTAPSNTNDLLGNQMECKEFYLNIKLGTAPGVGQTRKFYFHDGSNNLGPNHCEISGSNTSCSVLITLDTPPASVQIKSEVPSGSSPAATSAEWLFVCRWILPDS